MTKKRSKEGFSCADNVLFLYLGNGPMSVLTLETFIKLYTTYLCFRMYAIHQLKKKKEGEKPNSSLCPSLIAIT